MGGDAPTPQNHPPASTTPPPLNPQPNRANTNRRLGWSDPWRTEFNAQLIEQRSGELESHLNTGEKGKEY